jgi:coenzyme F420-dependent glucose-6-phosphate dehydrogenase
MRTHPAVVAHAAATAAAMMPGRFFLGVGTGENLNEHILGQRWPTADIRREMLREAVEVIRLLWEGGLKNHRGRHYYLEDARLYTLPEQPPPIVVAAGGPEAAKLAGEIGDGLVATSPDEELVQEFERAGGDGPRYGQVTVCYAEDEAEARRTAFEWWPNAALKGPLAQELPLPSHFEQAAKMVTEDAVAEMIVCGPDPAKHLELIRKYQDAGFDHVYVLQVGPVQQGFFSFYEREIVPHVSEAPQSAGAVPTGAGRASAR